MTTNFNFNLLATVQTVIRKQSYSLLKWGGFTRNAQGYNIDTYLAPILRKASIQPLKYEQMRQFGLDMTKEYIAIFDVGLIGLLDRDKNADIIEYNNKRYKALPTSNDWSAQGGWNEVYAVKIGMVNA